LSTEDRPEEADRPPGAAAVVLRGRRDVVSVSAQPTDAEFDENVDYYGAPG